MAKRNATAIQVTKLNTTRPAGELAILKAGLEVALAGPWTSAVSNAFSQASYSISLSAPSVT